MLPSFGGIAESVELVVVGVFVGALLPKGFSDPPSEFL
jgi:hypothetical protein